MIRKQSIADMLNPAGTIDREIFAFTHIKKAAGTTFTHILRTNFLFKHCDVVPLCAASKGIFQTADLKKLLMVNPFITSIAGHSIMPHGDLLANAQHIKFITILRDPIKRYISQYQHNVEKQGYTFSFDDFLDDPESFNKQTRTIAGTEDIEKAKNILGRRFFLVGIVEEFDNFLMVLRNKVFPTKFDPTYKERNVAKRNSPTRTRIENNIAKYIEKIKSRNELDTELYQYVVDNIFAKEKARYLNTQGVDNMGTTTISAPSMRVYADYILRKLYYRPILYTIGKMNKAPRSSAI